MSDWKKIWATWAERAEVTVFGDEPFDAACDTYTESGNTPDSDCRLGLAALLRYSSELQFATAEVDEFVRHLHAVGNAMTPKTELTTPEVVWVIWQELVPSNAEHKVFAAVVNAWLQLPPREWRVVRHVINEIARVRAAELADVIWSGSPNASEGELLAEDLELCLASMFDAFVDDLDLD